MKIYFNSDFIITKREHEEYYQGSDYHNKLIVAFPKLAYEDYTYIYPVFNVKRADGRVFGEYAITDFDTTDANYMTWSCDLPNKALEVEGTLEITVLFRYSNDGKYAKVSTGKVLLNVKESVIGEENDVIFTGSGDNLQGEIDAIRNEFGVRFDDVETHFISDMAELDSYTTPGLYKFNINNTNTFHLFVIKISDSLIGQTRSSRKGFYYRIINSGVASEWSYGSYNVNGITEYGRTISYNKGALVNYLGDLYLSLIDENTTPLNESWSKLEFTKFVKLEELDNYVLKEEGKGLSSNDYTNEEKAKVSQSVVEDDLKTINGESIVGSGNIEVKGADVDLSNYYNKTEIDGKVNAKEDKANLKALAYKDSLTKTDVGLGNVRNVESYSKTETDEKITDVIEIAKGKTNSYVVNYTNNAIFNSQEEYVIVDKSSFPITDIALKSINFEDLKYGDIIYITNTDVPDRWVGYIGEDFISFYNMETSKVPLNNYPTKTEISDLVNEYDAQLKNDIAEDYYNKTEIDNKNNFVFIYLGNIGVVTSSGKLTDEQYEIVNTTEKCSILYFQKNNNNEYEYFIRGTFLDTNPDKMVFYPLSRSSSSNKYIEVNSFKTWSFKNLDNVTKVNNKTGVVTLTANDVGAYSKTEVDTAIANKQDTLTAGEGITITDNVISASSGGNSGKKYMHIIEFKSFKRLNESGNIFTFTISAISNSATAYTSLEQYYNELENRRCLASGIIYNNNSKYFQYMQSVKFSGSNKITVYFADLDTSSSTNWASLAFTTLTFNNTSYYQFEVVDVYEI